ncbi:MAG: FimD/PapC C-terminal domain-containing protein [Kluyvera sp.]
MYLSGLASRGALHVRWGRQPNQHCEVHYQLPSTPQALVRQHEECN